MLSFAFFLLISPAFAINVIQVNVDKSVYVVGENISISGTVLSGGVGVSGVSLTLGAANQSDAIFSNVNVVTGSDGSFNYSVNIPSSTVTKFYTLGVTDGVSITNTSFQVIDERKYYRVIQIQGGTIFSVNTSSIDDTGYTLSELNNNSPHRIGNATIDGKTFYFILTDPDTAGVYNKVYIDDDKNFTITDAVENGNEGDYVESSALIQGNSWNNSYDIIKIFSDGSGLIIAKSSNKIVYSPSEQVSVIAVCNNQDDGPVSGDSISIEMNGVSNSGVSNSFGFFNTSFNAPSATGSYSFSVNNGLASSDFSVETFSVKVFITDVADNTNFEFLPSNSVKLKVKVFNLSNNNLIDLDDLNVNITNPNGSLVSVGLSDFSNSETGVYEYIIPPAITGNEGDYFIRVSVSINGDSQVKTAGFSVNSYSYRLMAINPRRMAGQMGERGIMSNSFAPADNISFVVMKVNNSKSGEFFMKLEDIASSNVDSASCQSLLSLGDVRDNNGLEVSASNVSIATVYQLAQAYGDTPEPFIRKQCAITFNRNVTGSYRVSVNVDDGVKSSVIGSTFSVQNLDAMAYTISDSSSDTKRWALPPNETVTFKVKVKDLASDSYLPDENITDVRIISVTREFPSYEDVTASVNDLMYDSVNATLNFTAPSSEGDYRVKFLFTANTSRGVESGFGETFMVLKKYMIFAQAGNCDPFCSPNQVISLNVNAIDINLMGSNGQTLSRTGNALSVEVESIMSESSFRTLVQGVDYNSTIGQMNANQYNATINITPMSLSSGFYNLRLKLTDLTTNDTYFGWGWFEVRSLITNVVQYDGSGYVNPSFGFSDVTYEAGDGVIQLALQVYNASGASFGLSLIDASDYSVNLDSIQMIDSWPPVTVDSGSYNSSTAVDSLIPVGSSTAVDYHIVNITGISEPGDYKANIKVNLGGLEDTGSFFFTLARFDVIASFRSGWPPTYSSSENVTINFTAVNISSGLPYDLGSGASVIVQEVFDESEGQPLRDGLVYSSVCSGSICRFELNTSSMGAGQYFARLLINDSFGFTKSYNFMFQVKDLIIGVPFSDVIRGCVSDSMYQEIFLGGGGGMYYSDPSKLTDPFLMYALIGFEPFNDIVNVTSDGVNVWLTNGSLIENGSPCYTAGGCNNACSSDPYCSSGVVGSDILDPWNRLWNIFAINPGNPLTIILKGLNVSYSGALYNTSYSVSGNPRICFVNESWMGSWDMSSESNRGADLNDDGSVDDYIYVLMIDNVSPNIYDSIIWSSDNVFNGSPVVIANSSPASRSFGLGDDKITALRVTSDGGLRYYINQPGDWSDLGESGLHSVFRIPFIATNPDGSFINGVSINISSASLISDGLNSKINLKDPAVCGYAPNITLVNGLGEVVFNFDDCAGDFSSGSYEFDAVGYFNGDVSRLDPWVKPRITLRNYQFIISQFPFDVGIDESYNLTFNVLSYNGSPISDANITITSMISMESWPPIIFDDFNASPVVAVTNSSGFASMNLTPTTNWDYGCYLIDALSVAVEGNESQTYWSCFWE